MQPSGSHKFKDEMTRRFHDYFYPKLKEKELDAEKFYADFKVAQISRYSFFSAMRSGAKGVTVDQVDIAWEKYGVRPDYLFGLVNQATSLVAEPPPTYNRELKKDLNRIRKALDELEKKIDNR